MAKMASSHFQWTQKRVKAPEISCCLQVMATPLAKLPVAPWGPSSQLSIPTFGSRAFILTNSSVVQVQLSWGDAQLIIYDYSDSIFTKAVGAENVIISMLAYDFDAFLTGDGSQAVDVVAFQVDTGTETTEPTTTPAPLTPTPGSGVTTQGTSTDSPSEAPTASPTSSPTAAPTASAAVSIQSLSVFASSFFVLLASLLFF